MAYQPIDSYGLIGNMRTAALVGVNGAIDWLCLPQFDSPSVFAALLDDRRGGTFRIEAVCDECSSSQIYWPETNVLLTRFRTDRGVAEITDFMPVPGSVEGVPPDLLRVVRAETGPVAIRATCRPAFDYARARHEAQRVEGGVLFSAGEERLLLQSDAELTVEDGAAVCRIELDTGHRTAFALRRLTEAGGIPPPIGATEAVALLDETVAWWRRWVRQCTYTGRWRDVVQRSALVLKLLTFEPTGAIIAAPTCSLPEWIGGRRNWDYRYTWLRDAGYTVYAFLRIGFAREAARFMEWLQQRCLEARDEDVLQPIYRIDGGGEIAEYELDHLEGYRGSQPVRVGNAAYKQLQLDVTGALMDAAYLHNKHAAPVGYETWGELVRLLEWVCRHWRERDEGVWEMRGPRRHHVFSKLMCWVALDRGVRLSEKRSLPADQAKWRAERDAIYREIMDKGWNSERGAFVQHYDADLLDAANLLMPLVFFIAPTDRRMLATIDAIRQPLDCGGLTEDFIVRRYDPGRTEDGVGGDEGAFNMCTFWLVEAMTRAGRMSRRRLEEAEVLFSRLLSCASPVGLYAEQLGPHREALGNYPQAFTHLALISAAYNLDRQLDARSLEI